MKTTKLPVFIDFTNNSPNKEIPIANGTMLDRYTTPCKTACRDSMSIPADSRQTIVLLCKVLKKIVLIWMHISIRTINRMMKLSMDQIRMRIRIKMYWIRDRSHSFISILRTNDSLKYCLVWQVRKFLIGSPLTHRVDKIASCQLLNRWLKRRFKTLSLTTKF